MVPIKNSIIDGFCTVLLLRVGPLVYAVEKDELATQTLTRTEQLERKQTQILFIKNFSRNQEYNQMGLVLRGL